MLNKQAEKGKRHPTKQGELKGVGKCSSDAVLQQKQ